jgi:hypothetical protein
LRHKKGGLAASCPLARIVETPTPQAKEARSQATKKGNETMGAQARSDAAKKGNETRLYKKIDELLDQSQDPSSNKPLDPQPYSLFSELLDPVWGIDNTYI